jgi:hypothetical protein
MIDKEQRGWHFEPYEDGSGDGYYTFRTGGPLYAIVEPADTGWQMCLFLEETDMPIGSSPASTTDSLSEAQAAAGPAIMKILGTWIKQTVEVWQQSQERRIE